MSSLPDSATPSSSGAWAHDPHTPPVPNTSLLPGSEKAPAPAVNLMNRVVQSAHDTIDRLADSAAPTVAQLSELRLTRDEWSRSLRDTVRSKPLVSVAAALALGALIARITR